ncbi:RrF2 family transcriptional regulator [Acetanaerobacterium elongatum]|uniref:Transcriptional regulator, BadM/Rrf2 family n=1 Tax=Acetanaerobacterium elongatum TaxID=258515 RepID=A0A1G9W296_9FIRM|nr:Rrf2 family transcriptional regulator [Acetanaerobacterium elongatum]SDM78311.1 transcriptional regulator, BadM/Rrf2 family [Acetanaerobacterium elongatum]
MRVSSRGRYGLAAMMIIAEYADSNEAVTVISISEKLGISKIYLEQVFALLKRAGLVTAIKGSQGGYRLAQPPAAITALDILQAVEHSLFESAEESVLKNAPNIEEALQSDVFMALDTAVADTLKKVTLVDLSAHAQRLRSDGGVMFYI